MRTLAEKLCEAPTSNIRKYFNMALEKDDCISFILGEPDFNTPQNILDAGHRALDEGYCKYTQNAGLLALRKLIAEDARKRKHIDVNPDGQVIVTCGGMQALYSAMAALLNPGEEIIMGSPLFPNYIIEAESIGAVPVYVEMKEEDHFIIQPRKIREAITDKTKAILLNSPSNPLGSVIDPDTLQEIAKIAIEYDLYVITDEVYQEFNYSDVPIVSIASLPDMAERTIVIDSFSKTYAMTGWRIGYAMGPETVITQMLKLQEGIISNVNAMAQVAAIEALEGSQDSVKKMISVFEKRKNLFYEGINQIPGLSCMEPKGAFYIFANIKDSGLSSEEFSERLIKEAGVAVVPGNGFGPGGEGYVRISYVVSEEMIEEGLRRMRGFMETLLQKAS